MHYFCCVFQWWWRTKRVFGVKDLQVSHFVITLVSMHSPRYYDLPATYLKIILTYFILYLCIDVSVFPLDVADQDSLGSTNEGDIEYTEVVHPQPVDPTRSKFSILKLCPSLFLFLLSLLLHFEEEHYDSSACMRRLEKNHFLGGI